MKYYLGFSFSGSDEETEIAKLTSTEEEPKNVVRIVITAVKEARGSLVTAKIERESIIENYKTKEFSNLIERVLEIDYKLPVGQALTIFADNIEDGYDALVEGYIEYEITK